MIGQADGQARPDRRDRGWFAAPPVFAALDLGTNNCRLLMAAPARGGFRVVDSFSRLVRLGEGLHRHGELSAAAMDRALAALRQCAHRLRRRPVTALYAVATEACRRASNGAAFLERVAAETGLRLQVITTREEAELALESCMPLLGDPRHTTASRALLFDIGGGSTELVWVRLHPGGKPELAGYVSLPVGVVTLADQYGDAVFTRAGYDAMVADTMRQLLPFDAIHCIGHELRCGAVDLIGTSGTVTTLAGVALGLPRYRRTAVDGVGLSAPDIAAALQSVRRLGRDGLVRHPCIGPDRADYTLPGCAIFDAIHTLWPAPRVLVADRGLRDGMLLRMVRHAAPPPAPIWRGDDAARAGLQRAR